MIRIHNGCKLGPDSSITLRDTHDGHTVRVSTRGAVPTNGCLVDGQAAIPVPTLHVEDMGTLPAGEQAEATIARLNPLLAAKAGSKPLIPSYEETLNQCRECRQTWRRQRRLEGKVA